MRSAPQVFNELPSHYVAFQMEQSVSSRWFTEQYIQKLKSATAVLDYSLDNIEFLQKEGIGFQSLYYTPISPTRPTALDIDDRDRPYEILFYGDTHCDRRKKILESLGKQFRLKILNNCFGTELYREIKKAKLVVNIHYYEGALLETTRLAECLSLGAIVVSEDSPDSENYPEISDLVFKVESGNVTALAERISLLLQDDDLRKAHRIMIEKRLSAPASNFDFYFSRFLLSRDYITFEAFYSHVGQHLTLPSARICLGLPEAFMRRKSFSSDNRFEFSYFPGLRHTLSWIGCGLSYKLLMLLAEKDALDEITICEDDVLFLPGWEKRLNAALSTLKESGVQWDILSGLIADLHPDASINRVLDTKEGKLVELDKMTSMVLNVYSKRFYQKLIEWNEQNLDSKTNTIDRYIENRNDVKVICLLPYLVGHKEDLVSTLWGFSNSTYSAMIAESERLLDKKVLAFESSSGPK